MSPRVIQLPLSGGDRKHYLRELKAAEQRHPRLMAECDAAYRMAHRLLCEEWNTRQFIGGPAEPSPTLNQAIHAGCHLLEVRCKRCGHESLVDLREVIWPRGNRIGTLAAKLRCNRCSDERKRSVPDLVALRMPPNDPPAQPGRRARATP
jgi:hypothetical protein